MYNIYIHNYGNGGGEENKKIFYYLYPSKINR